MVVMVIALVACEKPRPRHTQPDKPAEQHPVVVDKPVAKDPPPPPRHASHEHPHGAHPHAASDHHHHPHPHPHLDGPNGHHHPY